MANTNLFNTKNAGVPVATAKNQAGGVAYRLDDKLALAQMAVTGCLSDTFYTSAQNQLNTVLDLASRVDATFVAKTAVYARRHGLMKDMPALLVAHLAVRDPALFEKVAPQVIDNGRMIRNLVQILRSGQLGRSNLPRATRRFIRNWLNNRKPDRLFRDSVGKSPSLADVIKMVHPKPENDNQAAFYAYLIGKDHDASKLPTTVQQFEAFKAGKTATVPNVEHRMLDSLGLNREQWAEIAGTMGYQALRMNLNTLSRHGVFEVPGMAEMVAHRLVDREAIIRSRIMPYQLMQAYLSVTDRTVPTFGWYNPAPKTTTVPMVIQNALQDALEIALVNVPELSGTWDVAVDISGSMGSTVTGDNRSSTRCVDVAALVAASLLRKNPETRVWTFNSHCKRFHLNPRDTVLTNAERIYKALNGGTNSASVLRTLNEKKVKSDGLIMISDNQSWMNSTGWSYYRSFSRGTTESTALFKTFHRRNKDAKAFLIDIQPGTTTQIPEGLNGVVYNVGGFSDSVFTFIDVVNRSKNNKGFAALIDRINLDAA